MVLRPCSPPSSPAPLAHRYTAAGLDRDGAVDIGRCEELRHCLDLHVAVLQLPFIIGAELNGRRLRSHRIEQPFGPMTGW
jgi:hypothetical protein